VLDATDAEIGQEPAEFPEEGATAEQRKKRGVGFWLPVFWLVVIFGSAILAPLLPLDNPRTPDPCVDGVSATCPDGNPDGLPLAYPSTRHPLGTDGDGKDILSRVVWGGRVSLLVGIVAVMVGMLLGGAIGIIAGYYRSATERVLMAVVDIFLAFPALILALSIVAVIGKGLKAVCIAVAVVSTPAFARIARANTLTYAQREFVMASRVMGTKNSRIIVREVLPNVAFPLAAFALVVVAIAIVAEGGLAFLGLSVQAPNPSWGLMIADGKPYLDEAAFVALIPAGIMFLTVLSVNLLGDKFRAMFNVKEAAL